MWDIVWVTAAHCRSIIISQQFLQEKVGDMISQLYFPNQIILLQVFVQLVIPDK